MNSGRRRRADELFARALDAGPDERERLLDAECGGDVGLREELDSLLRAHDEMHGFMSTCAAAALGAHVPDLEPGEIVGGYRIVGRVGKGGSGSVYEAIQANPERRVALKVMRAGPTSPAQRTRLLEEARILARLDHPCIASVIEAGVHETRGGELSWFALEYMAGSTSLLDHVEANGLPRRERLRLFVQVCEAVHHGHQQGLLHCDLKPANLLVGACGRPKVIDFGIARALLDHSRADGAGTPPYMSPEQCGAGPGYLDVRSDVYCLGVVLFELLTGELPHDVRGRSASEARKIVRETPPLSIGTGADFVPADLASIVDRALAPGRTDRYSSAAALAEDLVRFLSHEPVVAHGGGTVYRVRKFARRQRVTFASLVLVVVVSLAGTIVASRFAVSESKALREAEWQSYVANVAAAAAAIRAADVGEARHRLLNAPAHLRNWEWRHLFRRLDESESTTRWPEVIFRAAAVSPDGRRVAATGSPPNWEVHVRVWEREAGRILCTVQVAFRVDALAFSSDGELLALGFGSGRVEIRRSTTGQLLVGFTAHEECVNDVALDPAGGLLATASRDGTIGLWSVADGSLVRRLEGHRDRVIRVSFAPDGRTLASAGRDGELRWWDPLSGECVRAVSAHEQSIESVAFSPDGGRIATASRDRTARIWDAESGKLVTVLSGHQGIVRSVRFSPDGTLVATGADDRSIRVWDARGLELRCFRGHEGLVIGLGFGGSDETVVSVSSDRTVRQWSLSRSGPARVFKGHTDAVTALAFEPGGTRLISGSRDGVLRIWSTSRPGSGRVLQRLPSSVHSLAWGRSLFVSTLRSGVVGLSLETNAPLRTSDSRGTCVAVGSGNRVAIGNGRGEIIIRDATTGRELVSWRAHSTAVMLLSFCGMTGRIVSLSASGELRVSDAAEGGPISTVVVWERRFRTIACSPDGRSLAAGDLDGRIVIYEVEGLVRRRVLAGHSGVVEALAFSPDGERLASAGWDRAIRLWDTRRWQPVVTLHGHEERVNALAFSQDGRHLASAGGAWESRACEIRVWEAD